MPHSRVQFRILRYQPKTRTFRKHVTNAAVTVTDRKTLKRDSVAAMAV
jgi:hypothetical protein